VNPNNGLWLNQTGPLITANNTVYCNEMYPSRVIIPIVKTPPRKLDLTTWNPDLTKKW